MSGHEKPDAPGLWKAAHGGYGVMFHDDGEPAMLLFGPGAKVRALMPSARIRGSSPEFRSAPRRSRIFPDCGWTRTGACTSCPADDGYGESGTTMTGWQKNSETTLGIVQTWPVRPVFAPSRRRGPVEAGLRRFHSDS